MNLENCYRNISASDFIYFSGFILGSPEQKQGAVIPISAPCSKLVRVLPQTKAFRTTVCSEVKMAGA
jgi:hypothetical protein